MAERKQPALFASSHHKVRYVTGSDPLGQLKTAFTEFGYCECGLWDIISGTCIFAISQNHFTLSCVQF
jgi:hypothetical protein